MKKPATLAAPATSPAHVALSCAPAQGPPAEHPLAPPLPDALRLGRQDMVDMEPLLAACLRRFVPFTAHSLYFPAAAHAPDGPQWLPRERTLLLPLVHQGELLGVFTARGASGRTVRRLLPDLPALAGLCLDHLEMERRARSDALTGLALTEVLLGRMAREADMVRQGFSGGGEEDMGPLHRVCMGLVVVRCRDWRRLAADISYGFADALLAEQARALAAQLPPEALAARTGDDEFAVLLPAGSRGACRKLSTALLPRLDAVSLPHPATRRPVRACCAVGHALYPQDMDAALLPLPMQEQARVLLHKARLAVTAAQQRYDALVEVLETGPASGPAPGPALMDAAQGREARVMGFGQVLTEGGVVRRVLPLNRVEVSLGRHMGAFEGLRFALWSAHGPSGARHCKGEIILTDVRDHAAVADMVYCADAADPLGTPDVGDSLSLLLQGRAASPESAPAFSPDELFAHGLPQPSAHALPRGNAAHAETPGPTPCPAAPAAAAAASAGPGVSPEAALPAPELLRHGDFLRLLGREGEGRAAFSLSLVRLAEDAAPKTEQDMEACVARLHHLCRSSREHAGCPPPVLSARYGRTSLIFLHEAGCDTTPLYTQLCHDAKAAGLDIAVGLAAWPTLRLTRADMPECCRKALDLALLLPAPRVGHFGSLALNISADKRYSRGDIFGAVEEYQQALLADRRNSMAWNSLGVCMAALSRQQEARGYFLKALQGWKRALAAPERPPYLPADTTLEAEYAATLYNLGTVCQALGERRAAARHLRLCVSVHPEHYFAHLRLGQWAEAGNRRAQARQHYQHAVLLEDRQARGGMARRHLARLAAKSRRPHEARELLHEVLRRDPQDAAAMGLLAELCLRGGEDPGMAEMLARNCVSLRGNHAPSWRLLGRALRALGRTADADAAEARAEAL